MRPCVSAFPTPLIRRSLHHAIAALVLSSPAFAPRQTEKCRIAIVPPAADTTAYLPCAVEKIARVRPNPAPTYPVNMQRAEIEGRVVVQFVLEKTGRVESGTIQMLKSTHDEF